MKKERVRKRIYKTRDLARADIFDYIDARDGKNDAGNAPRGCLRVLIATPQKLNQRAHCAGNFLTTDLLAPRDTRLADPARFHTASAGDRHCPTPSNGCSPCEALTLTRQTMPQLDRMMAAAI